MTQLGEDICYPSIFYPEKKFEQENYYYYESLSLNSNSNPNQAEINERSTYKSSDSQKNYFDCLSFMDFTNTYEKVTELDSPNMKIEKSSFSQQYPGNSKKLFYTFKREKKIKQPAMVCDFDYCGMAFRHKWIFLKHLSAHLTCKFFKCLDEKCNKLYKSKEYLNLHIKNIHEGIKPYKCQYCSLEFSHRNGNILFYKGKTYLGEKVPYKLLTSQMQSSELY